MIERVRNQIIDIAGRFVIIPAISAFVGTGAWFSDYIARDIAESAFKDNSKYGRSRLGQGVTNIFLPPRVRREVQKGIELGLQNFKLRQQVRQEVGQILFHHRRN